MTTLLLILCLIIAVITITILNKKVISLQKELSEQVKLGEKIARQNITDGAKISKLEEENKKLKEENLKANKCIRQQEKYVNELEEKKNNLQNAYDMLNEDTAKLMKERDTLQELVKTKDDEAEKPQEEEPKKTRKRTTKKK